MSKATAGPWYVYRDSAENFYVGSDIVDVARIVGSDADARLIAASPTMYEYLRELAIAGDERATAIVEAIHASR